MKLSIILSTKNAETNWNALRLANLAFKKGDEVSVFLLGEAVEYDKVNQKPFNIKEQVNMLLQTGRAKLVACGTCMDIRHKESSKTCPMGGIEDLYSLIATSDKVITF
ncbi:DsrE family protein [Candidatus Gottesmanbacteria bacterium]|nr:DsrE family protein [Candidatus Gottesmanbacteria bacterium]